MSDIFWKEYSLWCRGKEFPRETKFRKVMYNKIDLESEWKGVDDYVSIFSLDQVFYENFDTFYLDIDGKEGGTKEAWSKFEKIRKAVNLSRVYFSGVGIAAFVDLDSLIKGKDVYKATMKKWIKDNGVDDLVDPATVGDVRRVSKVPFTKSSKSGNTVVRFNINDDMGMMMNRSVNSIPTFDLGIKIFHVEPVSFIKKDMKVIEGKWKGEYPPCIEQSIMNLKMTGELNHRERLHFAAFLLQIGREDLLWDTLRSANDFSESISGYQVAYLKDRNFKPFNCVNVSGEICPFANKRECVFYPNIMVYMEKFK